MQTVFFSKSIIHHINTFSVYDLTFHPFPFYLYNFILLNTSTLQTNLLCHCVMFISVICHVTWAMWPIELVFIINIYKHIQTYIYAGSKTKHVYNRHYIQVAFHCSSKVTVVHVIFSYLKGFNKFYIQPRAALILFKCYYER